MKPEAEASARDSSRPAGMGQRAVRCMPVLEGHNLWANTYDLTPNPLVALEERILEPLLPDPSGKLVLDVACGTGRWLSKLRPRGARAVVGVDLSWAMLSRAAAKPGLRGSLVLGDARALPLPGGVADLVVNSFAAGYVDDLRAIARELARVTSPAGQIFITDFHPSNHVRGWRRTFRSGGEVIEISSFARPLRRIREEFESQGLEPIRCLEACLDEPERPLFEQAGKGEAFDAARAEPAIFICQFRRNARHLSRESKD